MAVQLNIIIDQGTDFSQDFVIKNEDGDLYDLSGYSANASLKKHYDAANSVAFGANISGLGTITLTLNHTTSANLEAGRYVYDIIISLANNITRVSEGIATIRPKVT